jgi:hypothetical protein
MKLNWGLYLAILAVPALPAATIDVSSNTSTSIASGDSLAFQVVSWNFARNAISFGQSIYPTAVSFSLLTDPIAGGGDFQATLQSADGSVSAAFAGPLAFTGGMLNSSGNATAVSTLNGYLYLSPLLSEALFSASPVLILTYDGPDLTLGLDSYTMRQELQVTLSGGPLTVGALQGPVTLQTPALSRFTVTPFIQDGSPSGPGGISQDSTVPEPDSALLSLGGGMLLVALSRLVRCITCRTSRRADRIAQEKSTVCNP